MTAPDETGVTTKGPRRRPAISAVLNTLNEERRIGYALRSVVEWVDEIVVVDMESDDRTAELARQFGARVFTHERTGIAEPARGFAIQQATGDWVLVLDADELVPPRLARELRRIADHEICDAVSIPWLNYLLGGPLMHTGWGPDQDRHVRFFRSGSLRTTSGVHTFGDFQPDTRIYRLPYREGLAIVHFNYLDVAHFLEKLNRYTDFEVDGVASTTRGRPCAAAVAATREFTRRYIKDGGWLDGWRGFYLSCLMAMYRIVAVAKVRERAEVGERQDVEARYRAEAERWLSVD